MQVPSDDVLARVDHLVYTTPDLELGIQAIEKLTGVRASAGGPMASFSRGDIPIPT